MNERLAAAEIEVAQRGAATAVEEWRHGGVLQPRTVHQREAAQRARE